MRAARVATLTHDVLTTQPKWVVDQLRRLHDRGELTAIDGRALAEQIAAGVTAIDRGVEPTSQAIPAPPQAAKPQLALG